MIIFFYVVFLLIFVALLGGITLITRKCLNLVEKIDDIRENLEEVASILDQQYQKMDAKSKIEVFSDEPVVRDLVKDIAESRDIVRMSAQFVRDTSLSMKEAEEAEEETVEKIEK